MADGEKMARLEAAFRKFDTDDSGFISPEEMRTAVINICEGMGIPESTAIAEADALIEESNAAGENDNKISFEEFVKVMSKY